MKHDAQHRAPDLIGEIYAALLGNGSWKTFVDRLSGVLPNGKATLFYHDVAARTGALTLNSQYDAASVEAYSRYYAARNPWMAKAACRPLDVGVRAEQMLPRAELLRSEFYADYLHPMGIESAVGVTVFRDHGCNFMLSVVCGLARDDEMQSAASLLGTLAPHLRQAFSYYRRAGGVASGLVAMETATDALGVAIVSVGADRRVRWANAAGQGLIDHGGPIGTNACGCITSSHGELREVIDLALGAAVRGESAGKTTITLPASDQTQPLTRITVVVPALASCERHFAGPCAVLIIETIGPHRAPAEDALRRAYSLTPSEARFACALADGDSVTEVAARSGITRETARTHLKRIFAKMEVGRQAELVAKVHRCRSLRGS
jgi:DNA-binding CsgD family transcriptional regulator